MRTNEEITQAQAALEDIKARGAAALGPRWEDVQTELFTPEEIAESKLRAALIGELIKARQEKGISQKKLEELSGVKQPVTISHIPYSFGAVYIIFMRSVAFYAYSEFILYSAAV